MMKPIAVAFALFAVTACTSKDSSKTATSDSATATSNPASANAALVYRITGEGNSARYMVREQLAKHDLPNDAVGVTKDVSGQISFDASGKVIPDASHITVGVSTLESDKAMRDRYVRSRVLETDNFPKVELAITDVRGLEAPFPTSGTRTFTIDGKLTVRGVTQPTTWNVYATFNETGATGKATTQFTFSQFNMNQPRVPIVLSVADTIRLEYDFDLKREGGSQ